MARLIVKSPYIKCGGGQGAGGYMKYIATRERVEIIPDDRPPTRKQEQLITKLVKDFPDTKNLLEYKDYTSRPTKANASAFITLALEENWSQVQSSEGYAKYIATRPRAERLGDHGLFGDEDGVDLDKAMSELEHYTGNVWTHIISLHREDAERLGYNNAQAWRSLLRTHRNDIAAAMKIPPQDFRWYAAFHDEGNHQKNGRQEFHPEYGHKLSGATIRRIHGVFHQAMDAAVRENLIARNPTEGITLPKKKTAPKQILNDTQLECFLEEIRADSVWHDFFYTELTTGLRQGEICGLLWSDFDEAHGTLAIRRTLHAQKGGRLVAGETKTGTGKRTITLPPSTAGLLAQRKKHSYSQWIFPNPLQPEQPTSPNAAYNHLKTLLKRAGLPSIRFHDLRHTFATHALASGVDAKTLSGILGHTQASFTLDTYTHVTGDMQKRASEIVGNFMEHIMVR